MTDLSRDLIDGVVLCHLAEVLSGRAISKFIRRPRDHLQYVSNMQQAFARFKLDSVRLDNIVPEDVFEQKAESVLRLLWALIENYQLGARAVSAEGKPRRAAQNELLAWVRKLIYKALTLPLGPRSYWHEDCFRSGRSQLLIRLARCSSSSCTY